MATPISVFISYARTDSSFVDRLEADLQARSIQTWVDRSKLEGGQNWIDELQRAVDRCQILLIVLSPEAVESEYVRMEYRYAQSLKRPVIPLEYHVCPKVPIDLNGLQWIDFKATYEQGLSSLLATLSRISPETIVSPPESLKTTLPSVLTKEPDLVAPKPAPSPPPSDLNALYRMGVLARAEGDLERAAALWQQVLSRDPNFGNKGLVAVMKQLQQEIHPYRIKRLRERALRAQQAGEWGQEIGAWQALLGLEPEDYEAKQAIPIAEENQKYVWMYEHAIQFLQEGQLAAAKLQLEMLWQLAPDYGDPVKIAERVGTRYVSIPRLQSVYRGYYGGTSTGASSGTMELSVEAQNRTDLKASVAFNGDATREPCKGTISSDGQILLKYAGPNPNVNMEFKGHLSPDGSIKGTFVSDIYNYTWEVS